MNSVEIKFRNKKDQKLVLALVERLRAEVIKKKSKKKTLAVNYLDLLAKTGGIPIQDPVEWQRTTRKDRLVRC